MHDRDLPARTSALRVKCIPAADASTLDAYLRRIARSKFAVITADWLRSGILTGLRPCEWATTRIDGDILVVRNAKATNGRGNGSVRHLDVSELSDADRRVLNRHVESAVGWNAMGEYAVWQERSAATLYEACGRLWPEPRRHYTLYSARHQALATAKRTMTAAAVSALAGHATERAAQRSYGRQSRGWRVAPGAAMPVSDEIATVKPWISGLCRKPDVAADVSAAMEMSPRF